MTTAIEIISRSLRLLGVLAEEETPEAQQAADGLTALNALMGSISNAPQLIFAKSLDSVSLSAGVASYTVGPTGTPVTQRPVDVLESSTITYQGVTYPLVKWTLSDFNQINVSATSGIPTGFYPDMEMPNIVINLWPVPSAPMTLNLWSNKQITEFSSLTQQVVMPPGYDRMLAFNLAIDMAPEYMVEPSPTVVRVAAQSRRMLKRTNVQVPRLQMPYGIPDNNTYRDWRSM